MTLSQESASPVFLACTSALLGIAEPKRRSVSCKQVAKARSTRPPTGQQPTKRTDHSNQLQLLGSARGKTCSGRNNIWECQRKHWDYSFWWVRRSFSSTLLVVFPKSLCCLSARFAPNTCNQTIKANPKQGFSHWNLFLLFFRGSQSTFSCVPLKRSQTKALDWRELLERQKTDTCQLKKLPLNILTVKSCFYTMNIKIHMLRLNLANLKG